MSRHPSLSICLVRPADERIDVAWPLATLKEHLRSVGHRVRIVAPGALREVAELAPDVVHSFDLTAASELAQDPTAPPVLVTPVLHDTAASARADLMRPIRDSDASVVVRSRGAQRDAHRLGIPWFRTWVLPVGVDVETFTRLGPMANRTDRRRVLTETSGPRDGVDDVVAAVARLDDVELLVLVDARDGERRQSLQDLVRLAARAAGVSDRVAVVTAASPGERAWWMRSAHVAVAVPHGPGGVDFVAEAMACGTPAVATQVDALADLVVHGISGFHVPPADPRSLARAIRTALEDDFAVEAYGMAAADRALSRLAWPRVAHELVGIYRSVIGARGGMDDPVDDDESSETARTDHDPGADDALFDVRLEPELDGVSVI